MLHKQQDQRDIALRLAVTLKSLFSPPPTFSFSLYLSPFFSPPLISSSLYLHCDFDDSDQNMLHHTPVNDKWVCKMLNGSEDMGQLF